MAKASLDLSSQILLMIIESRVGGSELGSWLQVRELISTCVGDEGRIRNRNQFKRLKGGDKEKSLKVGEG